MIKILPIGTFAILLIILFVYHGTGVHFLYWSDSTGYLGQGLSIGGPLGYDRSPGRSIGYPLLLALLSKIPATALAIVAVQALLAVAAYRALQLHLVAAADSIASNRDVIRAKFNNALPMVLALTSSYSALHIFGLSLLPEILFAVLGFLAAAAVARFVHSGEKHDHIVAHGGLVAAVAALPALVKPHWMLAAPALVAIVAAKLVVMSGANAQSRTKRLGSWCIAIVVPFASYAIATWPERYLSANFNRESALFGPRSLFCNHLHMIDDAFKKRPALAMHVDPDIDRRVREAIRDVRATESRPWKHLGFDGDHCTYNSPFQNLITELLPTVDAQRQLYMGTYLAAVRAEPLQFTRKIARQVMLGLERSFDKFDLHISLELPSNLRPGFLAGVAQTGTAGPLASKEKMKSTFAGWIVWIALGALFIPLIIVYLMLFAISLLAAPWRWRAWPPARRLAFIAYIGVPIAAILAHHLLIAITHTFDIWRYTFGVFFINLGFIAAAGLFWLDEAIAIRTPGARL